MASEKASEKTSEKASEKSSEKGGFLRELVRSWSDDSIGDTAAALTYYGMLALFPFLLFGTTLAGFLLSPSTVAQIVAEAGRIMPGPVTQIVGERLTSLQKNASSGVLSLGLVTALWAASGGIHSLSQALNRSYEVKETRPYWRSRGLAILVTLVACVLGVLAGLLLFALPVIGRYVGGSMGMAVGWLRFPVAGLIVVALWAFLYWVLPNVRPRFQLLSPGSLVGAAAWVGASWGFSEYVRLSKSYDAIYGTLGGVIVLLIWMWLSSAALLVGAEINRLVEKRRPAKPVATRAPSGGGEPLPAR